MKWVGSRRGLQAVCLWTIWSSSIQKYVWVCFKAVPLQLCLTWELRHIQSNPATLPTKKTSRFLGFFLLIHLLFQLNCPLIVMVTDHKQYSFRISFLIVALVFFSPYFTATVCHLNVTMMHVITALSSWSEFLITARSYWTQVLGSNRREPHPDPIDRTKHGIRPVQVPSLVSGPWVRVDPWRLLWDTFQSCSKTNLALRWTALLYGCALME